MKAGFTRWRTRRGRARLVYAGATTAGTPVVGVSSLHARVLILACGTPVSAEAVYAGFLASYGPLLSSGTALRLTSAVEKKKLLKYHSFWL